MRLITCLFFLTCATRLAAQSVFDRIAAGPREEPGSEVTQCGVMTMQFDFYDQNRRMSLIYTDNIVDYEGAVRNRGDYDVLRVDQDALLLSLDAESRLTADGHPVEWILRVTEDGTTCWQRADQGLLTCGAFTVPCRGDVPLS